MRRTGRTDVHKRAQKYNELEEAAHWKHKICALYLAGVEKKEIAKRLCVSMAIVDLYINQMKGEIANAKR